MLFGSNKQPSPQSSTGAASVETIFDVGVQDFETRVIHASMEKPVIVDFWAPWCAPCKQLMPILEGAVRAQNGNMLLAKVNLDENPELSQALRVQSVPTVFAFFDGRPIEAFQGMQPESQIKAFIDKVMTTVKSMQPDALDIPEILNSAAEALSQNDLQSAQGLYMQVLQEDEQNVQAYVGLIRTLIAAEAFDHAQQMIENAPPEISADSKFKEAQAAMEFAIKKPAGDLDAFISAVEKNPDDHQARLDLAEAQFASGAKDAAIETLLGSIAKDREWNDEAARKMLLEFFKVLGGSDPLTIQGRKKLSTLLFS